LEINLYSSILSDIFNLLSNISITLAPRDKQTSGGGSMMFRGSRFAASRFTAGPVRRGCSAADLFLATCYSYFSINLTKRRIFSVSCQCNLFINGLIASYLSDT
jgi:hypothetical protein